MKSNVALSARDKKTMTILIIALVVIFLIVFVKYLGKRKEMRELHAQAYEALKSPGEIPTYTEAELHAQAYEALKSPGEVPQLTEEEMYAEAYEALKAPEEKN